MECVGIMSGPTGSVTDKLVVLFASCLENCPLQSLIHPFNIVSNRTSFILDNLMRRGKSGLHQECSSFIIGHPSDPTCTPCYMLVIYLLRTCYDSGFSYYAMTIVDCKSDYAKCCV